MLGTWVFSSEGIENAIQKVGCKDEGILFSYNILTCVVATISSMP